MNRGQPVTAASQGNVNVMAFRKELCRRYSYTSNYDVNINFIVAKETIDFNHHKSHIAKGNIAPLLLPDPIVSQIDSILNIYPKLNVDLSSTVDSLVKKFSHTEKKIESSPATTTKPALHKPRLSSISNPSSSDVKRPSGVNLPSVSDTSSSKSSLPPPSTTSRPPFTTRSRPSLPTFKASPTSAPSKSMGKDIDNINMKRPAESPSDNPTNASTPASKEKSTTKSSAISSIPSSDTNKSSSKISKAYDVKSLVKSKVGKDGKPTLSPNIIADLELEAEAISSVADADKAKIDALIDSVLLNSDGKLSSTSTTKTNTKPSSVSNSRLTKSSPSNNKINSTASSTSEKADTGPGSSQPAARKGFLSKTTEAIVSRLHSNQKPESSSRSTGGVIRSTVSEGRPADNEKRLSSVASRAGPKRSVTPTRTRLSAIPTPSSMKDVNKKRPSRVPSPPLTEGDTMEPVPVEVENNATDSSPSQNISLPSLGPSFAEEEALSALNTMLAKREALPRYSRSNPLLSPTAVTTNSNTDNIILINEPSSPSKLKSSLSADGTNSPKSKPPSLGTLSEKDTDNMSSLSTASVMNPSEERDPSLNMTPVIETNEVVVVNEEIPPNKSQVSHGLMSAKTDSTDDTVLFEDSNSEDIYIMNNSSFESSQNNLSRPNSIALTPLINAVAARVLGDGKSDCSGSNENSVNAALKSPDTRAEDELDCRRSVGGISFIHSTPIGTDAGQHTDKESSDVLHASPSSQDRTLNLVEYRNLPQVEEGGTQATNDEKLSVNGSDVTKDDKTGSSATVHPHTNSNNLSSYFESVIGTSSPVAADSNRSMDHQAEKTTHEEKPCAISSNENIPLHIQATEATHINVETTGGIHISTPTSIQEDSPAKSDHTITTIAELKPIDVEIEENIASNDAEGSSTDSSPQKKSIFGGRLSSPGHLTEEAKAKVGGTRRSTNKSVKALRAANARAGVSVNAPIATSPKTSSTADDLSEGGTLVDASPSVTESSTLGSLSARRIDNWSEDDLTRHHSRTPSLGHSRASSSTTSVDRDAYDIDTDIDTPNLSRAGSTLQHSDIIQSNQHSLSFLARGQNIELSSPSKAVWKPSLSPVTVEDDAVHSNVSVNPSADLTTNADANVARHSVITEGSSGQVSHDKAPISSPPISSDPPSDQTIETNINTIVKKVESEIKSEIVTHKTIPVDVKPAESVISNVSFKITGEEVLEEKGSKSITPENKPKTLLVRDKSGRFRKASLGDEDASGNAVVGEETVTPAHHEKESLSHKSHSPVTVEDTQAKSMSQPTAVDANDKADVPKESDSSATAAEKDVTHEAVNVTAASVPTGNVNTTTSGANNSGTSNTNRKAKTILVRGENGKFIKKSIGNLSDLDDFQADAAAAVAAAGVTPKSSSATANAAGGKPPSVPLKKFGMNTATSISPTSSSASLRTGLTAPEVSPSPSNAAVAAGGAPGGSDVNSNGNSFVNQKTILVRTSSGHFKRVPASENPNDQKDASNTSSESSSSGLGVVGRLSISSSEGGSRSTSPVRQLALKAAAILSTSDTIPGGTAHHNVSPSVSSTKKPPNQPPPPVSLNK